MNVKPRGLFTGVSGTPEDGDHSTLFFTLAVLVLGVIACLFVRYAIPVISAVVCDILKHSFDAAGGLFR